MSEEKIDINRMMAYIAALNKWHRKWIHITVKKNGDKAERHRMYHAIQQHLELVGMNYDIQEGSYKIKLL